MRDSARVPYLANPRQQFIDTAVLYLLATTASNHEALAFDLRRAVTIGVIVNCRFVARLVRLRR